MVGALARDLRDLSSSCWSSVAASGRHVAFLFLRGFFSKWQIIHLPYLTGMLHELNILDEVLRCGSGEEHVDSEMVGIW